MWQWVMFVTFKNMHEHFFILVSSNPRNRLCQWPSPMTYCCIFHYYSGQTVLASQVLSSSVWLCLPSQTLERKAGRQVAGGTGDGLCPCPGLGETLEQGEATFGKRHLPACLPATPLCRHTFAYIFHALYTYIFFFAPLPFVITCICIIYLYNILSLSLSILFLPLTPSLFMWCGEWALLGCCIVSSALGGRTWLLFSHVLLLSLDFQT